MNTSSKKEFKLITKKQKKNILKKLFLILKDKNNSHNTAALTSWDVAMSRIELTCYELSQLLLLWMKLWPSYYRGKFPHLILLEQYDYINTSYQDGKAGTETRILANSNMYPFATLGPNLSYFSLSWLNYKAESNYLRLIASDRCSIPIKCGRQYHHESLAFLHRVYLGVHIKV